MRFVAGLFQGRVYAEPKKLTNMCNYLFTFASKNDRMNKNTEDKDDILMKFKKAAIIVTIFMALVILLASCDNNESETSTADTSAVTTAPADEDIVDGKLVIVDQNKTKYSIVYNTGDDNNSSMLGALTGLRSAFKAAFGDDCGITLTDDYIPYDQQNEFVAPEYEILIGATNRSESEVSEELAFNEGIIKVVGKKIVIYADSVDLTAQAVRQFTEKYVVSDNGQLLIDSSLSESVLLDLTYCNETEMTYADMAMEVYESFSDKYLVNGWIPNLNFWDTAEIIECYIDAYECTKDEDIKTDMLRLAKLFYQRNGTNWKGNKFNDDIMWICIAYCRITMLTGDETFYRMAKLNYDMTYERAYSTHLGGGLFWTTDNETKNSCVNCPGAIAACLIGEISGDESYFEKAKGLIEWELDNMFVASTGQVYDSYNLRGEKNKWASTYNQGTFVGANMLLYRHYKDDSYLQNAKKAANYAMRNLTTSSGIINVEANLDNGDLPGFKGILTRWFYRFAKETNDLEILTFLQKNAAAAFNNRNSEGIIWTDWSTKTPEPDVIASNSGYRVFGMSTALALMFNCQQWW